MPRFSANLSTLFTELPFLDRFAAAKDAGFDAVECWFPYPYPTAEISSRLDDLGLTMVGINSASGAAGEWGLAALPGHEAEFRASLDDALHHAAAYGDCSIHVMAGLAGHLDAGAALATYLANLEYAVRRNENSAIKLMIEPLNRHDRPGYLLGSVDQAAGLIEGHGLGALKIMFDCYHVARQDGDVLARLRRFFPLIGHIQIAGIPTRGAPDEGELDYRPIYAAIDELSWKGWVGAEYIPLGATSESLRWLEAHRNGAAGQ